MIWVVWFWSDFGWRLGPDSPTWTGTAAGWRCADSWQTDRSRRIGEVGQGWDLREILKSRCSCVSDGCSQQRATWSCGLESVS